MAVRFVMLFPGLCPIPNAAVFHLEKGEYSSKLESINLHAVNENYKKSNPLMWLNKEYSQVFRHV